MSGDDLLVDGSQPPERRKARHLIDWDNPPPPRRREPMSLTQVQRWVISTLTMVTILHFAGGIVLAAATAGPDRAASRVVTVTSQGFGLSTRSWSLAQRNQTSWTTSSASA